MSVETVSAAESSPRTNLIVTVEVPLASQQPTMQIAAVGRVMGVSRGTAYEAARKGDIPTITIGGRLLVPTAWVRRVLQLDDPGTNGLEDVSATAQTGVG